MDPLDELLGTSAGIVALLEQVRHVVALPQRSGRLPPILLQGETGTGKGLLARLIHRTGARASGPFVDVNCAAIPETLLETELFGFERGAFTDARQAKPGLFRAAHGGTLFLDEVGLLSEPLQAKLLTALDDRAVRPLGSTHTEPVDVWIIAATNEHLVGEVRARRFREDLYHRLAVLTLTLPPLRERREDIVLLAEHVLSRECAEYGLPPKQLSVGARRALRDYPWPGNVRELNNVIERAALIAKASVITPEILKLPPTTPTKEDEPPSVERMDSIGEQLAGIERGQLLDALRRTNWNITRAAQRLGVPRHWLRHRMDKHQLSRTQSRARRTERHAQAAEPAPPTLTKTPLNAVSSPAVRWERRHVGFLGAAVVVLPAGSGPGTGQALAVLADKVQAFGGRLLDVGTTLLVAVFGLEAAEDPPISAALAAVAVLKAAERARRDASGSPGIAVAIHVAPVMVGRLSGAAEIDVQDKHAAWTALTALLAATEPDSISISSAAAPFLDRRFDLVPTEQSDGAPGPIHRLTLSESTAFHLGARFLTRFVGRQPELAILGERLAQVEDGHGQVVCVVGEPGVGKSRFVYELTRSDRARGRRILHGRTVASDIAAPWRPITELLTRCFAVDDADPLPQIRDKVTAGMRARGLEADVPALLVLLDVPVDDPAWRALDPPQRRRRLVDAVKRMLARESERQPLLVIIEDLHWGDTETRSFLDTLVDRLPTAAILLVVTCRPGFQHDWGGKTYYTQLRLDALSPESAGDLLDALLGNDLTLGELKEILIARTEGNPFFLEESVRSLVETGALAGGRGAYALTAAVPRIEMPATVQAILAARVDRLPADEKRILQSAAVIGRDVPFPLLQAIADLAEDDLQPGLAHLQGAEFLHETGFLPDLEYTFKHALTHEVAYGGLLQERRRSLHARIVEAMETMYAGRLAEHLERLGHHAFRGELWEKAGQYLWQSGAKAFDRSANHEATSLFEQALQAVKQRPQNRDTVEQIIDLTLDLRNALTALGEFRRLEEVLQESHSLAEALSDQRRLGQVSGFLAHVFTVMGEHARAIEAAGRALAIGHTDADLRGRVVANLYFGQACYQTGEYRRASEVLQSISDAVGGDAIYERFGLAGLPSVLCRTHLAMTLAALGQFAMGRTSADEALRIADLVGQPFSQVLASWGAVVYSEQGDLARAIPMLERGLTLCRAAGIFYPFNATFLGEALLLAGRLDEAGCLLQDARDSLASTQTAIFLSRTEWALGEVHALAGRPVEARECASRALDLSRRYRERGVEAWTLRLFGEIHARRDPPAPDEAEGSYQQARALADELGMRPLVAHCHLSLGKLYRRTCELEKTHEHLAAATTMYRAMDMRYWLREAEAQMVGPAEAPLSGSS